MTASVSCRCCGARATLPRRELFWHYPHYWNGGKVSPYSVARVGDWKLIRFYETGQEELYNLRDDLGERHDLAGSQPEKHRELALRLDSWLKQVGAQMPVGEGGWLAGTVNSVAI